MKILGFGSAICAIMSYWAVQSPPARVSDEVLSQTRGNTACAVSYPTTDGCTTCVSAGTISITYSYYVYSTLYTYTTTVPTFARSNDPNVDQKCMTYSTFLSSCNKASANCALPGAKLYMDNVCTNLVPVQPTTGIAGQTTYTQATVTPDTGLTCTGVTYGLF
jgi:hypothetical protein